MVPADSSRRLPKVLIILSIFFVLNIADSCFCPAYPQDAFYSIRVASYRDLDNAVNQMSALEISGLEAFYKYETVNGKGNWYRVYVGRFDTRDEAEKIAKTLMRENTISDYYITTVEQGVDEYDLHVSSYLIKIQAEDEVHRIEKHGFKAFYMEEEVSGKRWFRVYIGTFPDEQQARQIGAELNIRGIISFFRPKRGAKDIPSVKETTLLEKEQDDDVESPDDEKFSAQETGRAYYDFGVFAYEDGDYGDAEKNFIKALEITPDDPFCQHFLGKTYLKLERYQEAKSCLNKAWKVNPDMSGLKYDLAFLNYKMSDYSKAADLFAEIAIEEPTNILAHYHAGISLYKQKRFGKATDYFIRAAEMSPSIKANSHYYAGMCDWNMGRIQNAGKKFEYVRDNADSESLRENAVKWLQVLEKNKKASRPYRLYLKIAYQYDDNVRLEPLDQDIYADEDDYVTVGYFSGMCDVMHRDDYKIGVGYSHYQTWHHDLDDFDLVGNIFNLYAKYRLHPFTFGLSYIPSYYRVDSDKYLRRRQLKPEVIWKVDENLSTRFSYSYYDNNNFQNNDRDGHANDLYLDVYYSILDKRGRLFAGIGYEDNDASHADEYYDQLKTKLGVSLKVPWDLDLSLTGNYYDKDYNHVDSFYGLKRKDTKYHGSVSLSRRLFYDWLSGSAEFNYTKNDSNINNYEYERKVTSLSVTARY
jgi:tetratricopeptide (TPR) repeat protein